MDAEFTWVYANTFGSLRSSAQSDKPVEVSAGRVGRPAGVGEGDDARGLDVHRLEVQPDGAAPVAVAPALEPVVQPAMATADTATSDTASRWAVVVASLALGAAITHLLPRFWRWQRF